MCSVGHMLRKYFLLFEKVVYNKCGKRSLAENSKLCSFNLSTVSSNNSLYHDSIQLHLHLVSLRKLQSLKHRLSRIRFLEKKKCELIYSDAMLTFVKEYTWNQCGLSKKA